MSIRDFVLDEKFAHIVRVKSICWNHGVVRRLLIWVESSMKWFSRASHDILPFTLDGDIRNNTRVVCSALTAEGTAHTLVVVNEAHAPINAEYVPP